MIVKKIKGYDVILGESQGYQGLPVRVTVAFDPTVHCDVPTFTSQWTFSDEERLAIASGSDVFLMVQTQMHPPVNLVVGDPNPPN
jgi:hypothetical protein